uniref:CCHC-type domain-containing protein n=1 Tax=Lactuca sativa TaxID=4236 RepID=A0A9R1VFD3_LACSA|nr:hypothetical protein LSAT_V11C500274710 [Lactuca sativa]
MRAIADDLALGQSPITEEDLLVHILSQLGDECGTIVAAIKVRETPLSYSELFDKLSDFERALKVHTASSDPVITTVDYTSRQSNRSQRGPNNCFSNQQSSPTKRNQWSSLGSGGSRPNKNNLFCQFCNFPGHMTRDCRKLSRLLRENNITINNS